MEEQEKEEKSSPLGITEVFVPKDSPKLLLKAAISIALGALVVAFMQSCMTKLCSIREGLEGSCTQG